MKKIFKIISPFVILLAIVLIVLFQTIPAGKLWEKYVVLYVPVECEDTVVLDSIKKAGIRNVVALSEQYLPLDISEDSVEYAMFKTTIDEEENQYISDRKSYFFDQDNKFRLYYIPKEYEDNIDDCISMLKEYKITCGLDSNAKYPIVLPIIVTIFTLAICFFSRNKILFLLSSVIPNLYVYCNPFFPIALSICLLILCSFFVSSIWKRKGAVSYLNSFIFIPFCFVVALLCGFSSSLVSGLLFIAVAAGMVSVFISYYWIQDILRDKKSFVPVYIMPAKLISVNSHEIKAIFSIVAFTVILLTVMFSFSSSSIFDKTRTDEVSLPSASSSAAAELPQLDDYYKWAWNVTTYPYKSLNREDSTSFTFPVYESVDGQIVVKENVVEYNTDFEEDIFNKIDNLQFNSIEEVMRSEGASFQGGYNTSSGSYHLDLFGIIMIIVCYFILIFIYFSIIMKARKGAKK